MKKKPLTLACVSDQDLEKPSLDTSLRRARKGLFYSLLMATGTTGGIAGILAVISVAIVVLDIEKSPPLTITTASSEPPPEELVERISLRPQAPAFPPPIIPRTESLPLMTYTPPVPDSIPEVDYGMEELEIENPFARKAESKKEKAKKPKRVAKKTTKPKRKTKPKVDPAVVARKKAAAKARRRAALAKKITRKASVASRATPSYPKSARRKKQEGRVVVTVTVGASGKVTSCHVSKSSRIASLDSAALRAARKFRFKPARNGLGQAVVTKKALPFTFKLKG